MERLDDNFRQLKARQSLYVADIATLNLVHLLDAEMMDEQQNLDAPNLGEVLTFLDEVRHFLVNLEDVQVDAEQRHLLRKDYFLDVADAEPHHLLNRLLKRDYFRHVAPA
jgi:predicted nucleic-acid-binding protein